MKKALAEIIAGCIPCKMQRNRWRGILRYGVRKALRLKRSLRHPHPAPEVYLAICAIAKDEGPYFKEWLNWHINQGVDKFYIYDNGSTDCTQQVLTPYIEAGIVDYRPWPGHRMQIAAYDHCIDTHRFDTKWIAFIDLDEFIVPVKDSSIPQFLSRFEGCPAVEINWLIYGSGGALKKQPGTMMQRFKKHSHSSHPLNRHVKSIVDPRLTFNMIGCHEAAPISGRNADSHGQPITSNFREREPQQDVIKINHYAVRSYQEFTEKQARGRASGTQKTVPDEYFRKYDLNDISEE